MSPRTRRFRDLLSLLPLLSVALMLALTGCATSHAPEGFAAYRVHGSTHRAVSPDGVVFRIKTVDNEPEAALDFWAEALKNRQEAAGYVLITEAPIEAGALKGSLLHLEAPWGPQDVVYLIALFVDGDDLIIVESAGAVGPFAAHREAILAAIASLPQGS